MRSIHALGAVVLVVALAACTPAAPKPTPTVTVTPLTIPDCETMLPLTVARALFGAKTEFVGETPAAEFVPAGAVPSLPVVMSTASPTRACRWGIPNSDGAFSLLVAAITDAERQTLVGELTAGGFAETTTGALSQYALDGELAATYLFSQRALVLSQAPVLDVSASVSDAALDALRTANPSLGL
jgi:hypothetical protein